MASKNKTGETLDRARGAAAQQLKPVAEQIKPLAKTTGAAAKRGVRKSRAWAAPQVERTGQVLQDKVAPKVSAMLSSAAERIDPGKPSGRRWRWPVTAATLTAAAGAVAAVFRRRGAASQEAAPYQAEVRPETVELAKPVKPGKAEAAEAEQPPTTAGD